MTITFTLSEPDAQKVVDAVATLPYKDVHLLVQNLLAQAQQQVQAAQQAQAGLPPVPTDPADEEAASDALTAPQRVVPNGKTARA
jgi:hypothetical protein